MTNSELPQELRDKVAAELESGERIEWMGQPIPQLFSPAALAIFFFAIPWTAFSLFWMAGASGMLFEKGPKNVPGGLDLFSTIFPLFGLPFVFIGIGMLSAPYWMRRAALKTVYFITDRRAIAIEGGFRSTTVRVYRPDQLSVMTRKERYSGRGDIILSEHSWRDSDGDRRYRAYGFMNIPNVVEAYKKLEQLAQASKAGTKDQENT